MVRVSNSEQLKNAMLSFEKEVTFNCLSVQNLLTNTYREYPQVLYYLCQITPGTSLFEKAVEFGYRNTEIASSRITVVKTAKELEDHLHFLLSRYRLQGGIVINSSLDFKRIITNFNTEYNTFYSNMTNIQYMWAETFSKDYTALTIKISYRIGSIMLGVMEREVDNAVATLKKQLFCADMSEGIKAYVAHNYLAKSVDYFDPTNENSLDRSYAQSAYGALIKKKCVCQGYAEAYKRILDEIGVECAVISGKIKGSTEYHAWNIVKINGTCYHVDVTWDSLGGGRKNDTYFAKNDQFMNESRFWTRNAKLVCNLSGDGLLAQIRAELILKSGKFVNAGADRNYLK